MNPVRKFIARGLCKVLGLSPYETANRSNARGWLPAANPRDEKHEMTLSTRRELVRKSRYHIKNSGLMREMVGDMAIYSVGPGIRPQAQTDDPEWNRKAEEIYRRFSHRPDITGRFSMAECQRLICRATDNDGEMFVVKVRDRNGRPRIQLIETHRVTDDGKGDSTDGLIFDEWGAPRAYCMELGESGKYRRVPAPSVMHIFEPEWVSAARSVPTMQHGLNHVQDESELLALEKRAVKDHSNISRIIKTEDGKVQTNTDFQVELPATTDDCAVTSPKKLQKIIGGVIAAIKPNESIDSFESKRPSPTFTGFLEHLLRVVCGGMLPYEFVADPSKVGGASVRLITTKAGRRFELRQQTLIERFLIPTWGYIIGDAIDRGELEPVKDWYKVKFIPPKKITVDAGREGKENRADVQAGLKTIEEHFNEVGKDFEEEVRKRVQNAKFIMEESRKAGVPLDMVYQTGSTATPPPSPEPEKK